MCRTIWFLVTPTEKRTNRFGEVIALEPALAKYTRRGLDMDTYWFVQYGMTTQPYQFTKGSIFHLMEPDINGDLRPARLSFCHPIRFAQRVRHAVPPQVLHQRQPCRLHHVYDRCRAESGGCEQSPQRDEKCQRSGNFRNLFMYSPNGKKTGFKSSRYQKSRRRMNF